MERKMLKVTRNFTIVNVVVSVVILAFVIFLQIYTSGTFWGYLMMAAGLLEGMLLIFGVLYMRKKINKIGGILANEKLIIIHLVNFILWSIAFVAQNLQALNMETMSKGWTMKQKKSDVAWLKMAVYAEIIGLIAYIVQTYMDLFLLYLIAKFSYKKQDE